MEDDIELKDLLVQTLEAKGSLSKLKVSIDSTFSMYINFSTFRLSSGLMSSLPWTMMIR